MPCRALEALLDGAAPTASKRALLQRLASCAAGIAATAPGSFLVEKAFSKGDAGVKEAIAGELAKRVKELQVRCMRFWSIASAYHDCSSAETTAPASVASTERSCVVHRKRVICLMILAQNAASLH